MQHFLKLSNVEEFQTFHGNFDQSFVFEICQCPVERLCCCPDQARKIFPRDGNQSIPIKPPILVTMYR